MISEPTHLNPEVGWDKDIVSYFDHSMTHCKHDNEVQNNNDIKVTIELNIRYEQAAPVVINEEEAEQELLCDL